MKGHGGKGVGPSLDWLRETREQAEGGGKGSEKEGGKGGGKTWSNPLAGRSRSRSGARDRPGRLSPRRSRSRSRDGGGKGKTKGKDKGKSKDKGKDKGGKGETNSLGDPKDNPETSRNLIFNAPKRSRSGSSSSTDVEEKKQRRRNRAGFDSTVKQSEAKTPAAAAPKKKKNAGLVIEFGAKVDIHGLVGAAQYNGREGTVKAGPNEKGRWLVQVLLDGDMKDIALKPENLQPKPTCGWELVVSCISESTTESDVSDAFARFGSVLSAKVTRDLNGVSKGVALVVMDLKESAQKAMLAPVEETEWFEVPVRGIPAKVKWSTMVQTQMGLMKNRDEVNPNADEEPKRKFQEKAAEKPAEALRSGPFEMGTAVNISGLKGAPQYNGSIGVVKGFRENGRCEVLLREAGREDKTLVLKVENLSPAHAKSSGGAASKIAGQVAAEAPPQQRRFSDAPKQASAESAASPATSASSPPAAAAGAAESTTDSAEPRKRRRGSLWGEGNDGGEVYVGGAPPAAAEVPASTEKIASAPVPDEAVLQQMNAKELKQILVAHHIDVSGCFEKAEFLEKALSLATTSQSV